MVASLGAIGILTKVQFRLIDQPYYETIQKIIRLKDVLSDLEQTSREYDFWRIDWIPDTDNGLLWAAKQVPTADPEGDYADDQSENILVAVFKALDKFESAGPLLDNAMRMVYAGITLTYGQVKASGPLRTMLPVDRRAPLKVAMAEWSFNPADLQALAGPLPAVLSEKRLAQPAHRDRADQNRRFLHVALELAGPGIYPQVQFHVPDGCLQNAG